MGLTGGYDIKGSFDRGMPGDGFSGSLAILEDAPPSGGTRILFELDVTIAGKHGRSQTFEADGVWSSDKGALSFSVMANGQPYWSFSGYLNGRDLVGRHTLTKSRKPLYGPWSATPAASGS